MGGVDASIHTSVHGTCMQACGCCVCGDQSVVDIHERRFHRTESSGIAVKGKERKAEDEQEEARCRKRVGEECRVFSLCWGSCGETFDQTERVVHSE